MSGVSLREPLLRRSAAENSPHQTVAVPFCDLIAPLSANKPTTMKRIFFIWLIGNFDDFFGGRSAMSKVSSRCLSHALGTISFADIVCFALKSNKKSHN